MKIQRPRLTAVSMVLAAAATLSTSSGALIVDGYSDATNDRFTNSASFIMSAFDLSGVGQTSSGRWATAISRNVIISSAHYRPSGEVTFYEGNDATATPVTRTIASGMVIPNTDLYLGTLDSNLPSSITHYNYATETLSSQFVGSFADAGVFQDQTAYVFGRTSYDIGSDPNRSRTSDQAVGQNKISAYIENVAFRGNTDNDSLVFNWDRSGPDELPYEAQYRSGDSGAPAFVEQNGGLLLIGTAAFTWSSGSGINYTGNSESNFSSITNFISASAVPEPSAFLLGLLTIFPALARRRRQSKPAPHLS